jgi:hypothetical protein
MRWLMSVFVRLLTYFGLAYPALADKPKGACARERQSLLGKRSRLRPDDRVMGRKPDTAETPLCGSCAPHNSPPVTRLRVTGTPGNFAVVHIKAGWRSGASLVFRVAPRFNQAMIPETKLAQIIESAEKRSEPFSRRPARSFTVRTSPHFVRDRHVFIEY